MADEDDINVRDIRLALFTTLNKNPNYDKLPYSDICSKVEIALELPPRSLRSYKDTIMDMMLEYKNTKLDDDTTKKTGKFSAAESTLIMRVVQEYLDANSLQPGDICISFRDENVRGKRYPELWRYLVEIMPGRDRNVSVSFLLAKALPLYDVTLSSPCHVLLIFFLVASLFLYFTHFVCLWYDLIFWPRFVLLSFIITSIVMLIVMFISYLSYAICYLLLFRVSTVMPSAD
jgi:hypothetical protein